MCFCVSGKGFDSTAWHILWEYRLPALLVEAIWSLYAPSEHCVLGVQARAVNRVTLCVCVWGGVVFSFCSIWFWGAGRMWSGFKSVTYRWHLLFADDTIVLASVNRILLMWAGALCWLKAMWINTSKSAVVQLSSGPTHIGEQLQQCRCCTALDWTSLCSLHTDLGPAARSSRWPFGICDHPLLSRRSWSKFLGKICPTNLLLYQFSS